MVEHHWVGRVPNPKKYFGFVYLITNLKTGKMYVGKKQYHKYRKRKPVGESNWPVYTSSSKYVTGDLRRLGMDAFEFKILRNYRTRGGLVYGEANLQHKRDVLTKRMKGTDERLYYNAQIGAIKFLPKEW